MPALVGLSLIAINIPTTPDPGLVAIVYTGTLLNSTSMSPIVVIGPPAIVSVSLVRPTLCTVPSDVFVELMVTAPFELFTEIPSVAVILVTPVLVTVMLPLVVIGPPDTEIPVLGVNPTLVTVPPAVPLAIAVTLPYASTVTFACAYAPAVTPDVAKSKAIVPEDTIGLPETVKRDESVDTAILVTVPPAPPPPPLAEIVMLPVVPLSVTPVPALNLETPVFVIVTVPVAVFDVTSIPSPDANVLKLLALANNESKFTLIFENAEYSESLPVDSLGRPTLIDCFPVIAIIIFVPYTVFIY